MEPMTSTDIARICCIGYIKRTEYSLNINTCNWSTVVFDLHRRQNEESTFNGKFDELEKFGILVLLKLHTIW